MANTRDIKRRIASVQSIGHITKAMEMVAGAKLRRAQANVIASRPYTLHLSQLMGRLQESGIEACSSLLEAQSGPPVYVVVTGDRGLSGGYNANILRFAEQTIPPDAGVVAVGRKAKAFFLKVGRAPYSAYNLQAENPAYSDATSIAKPLLVEYQGGKFGSLHIIYTEFISALNHKPVTHQLLPILAPDPTEGGELHHLYEPSPQAVLARLLPHYVCSMVYAGLLAARAAELGAQRLAMKAATDNANEMIDELTMSFNRARQTAITQEILEVVNGAQALEG